MHRRDLIRWSPLVFASAAVEQSAPAQGAQATTAVSFANVRSYGATGDGKTVDTPAVNQAIAAVAAAGGGLLVFPAGTFVCFTIKLQSNVSLYLSDGCTILAADSPRPGETTGYRGGVYDAAGSAQPWEQYQDYGHNHWNNSLIVGDGLHNISICGPGLIHGKGLSHGSDDPRPGQVAFHAEQPGVGNKAIALKNCRNVLLRDFSVLKGGHFAVLATGVDNLTIENLRIDTDRDGLDIDCCRNVRVSNCTVNSPWDDGICPKSSYALGYARATENVTISDCFVTGNYQLGSLIDGTWKRFPDSVRVPRNGRIKCGTESNGGFQNIAISNCVLEGSKGIALETADGAVVEDIAVSNVAMREISDAPFFLRLNRRNRGPEPTMRPGTLRRVVVSNVVSHDSASVTASILSGVPGSRIEDVKFNQCFFGHRGLPAKDARGHLFPDWHGIQVPEIEDAYPDPNRFGPTPASGFFIRHLERLEMSHVEIAAEQTDPRPAFWLQDVQRADFFAVTAPPQPNFALRQVTDLRIFWSRAAKDVLRASVDNETM